MGPTKAKCPGPEVMTQPGHSPITGLFSQPPFTGPYSSPPKLFTIPSPAKGPPGLEEY